MPLAIDNAAAKGWILRALSRCANRSSSGCWRGCAFPIRTVGYDCFVHQYTAIRICYVRRRDASGGTDTSFNGQVAHSSQTLTLRSLQISVSRTHLVSFVASNFRTPVLPAAYTSFVFCDISCTRLTSEHSFEPDPSRCRCAGVCPEHLGCEAAQLAARGHLSVPQDLRCAR